MIIAVAVNIDVVVVLLLLLVVIVGRRSSVVLPRSSSAEFGTRVCYYFRVYHNRGHVTSKLDRHPSVTTTSQRPVPFVRPILSHPPYVPSSFADTCVVTS